MRDMDVKSEEELWDMLNQSEQQAFLKSLKTGGQLFFHCDNFLLESLLAE